VGSRRKAKPISSASAAAAASLHCQHSVVGSPKIGNAQWREAALRCSKDTPLSTQLHVALGKDEAVARLCDCTEARLCHLIVAVADKHAPTFMTTAPYPAAKLVQCR
jgi:hypothetical protein